MVRGQPGAESTMASAAGKKKEDKPKTEEVGMQHCPVC